MSDKTTSQTHNSFPFAAPALDAIRQAAEAHISRVQSFYDTTAQWESRGAEQTRGAIDESARLMRESVLYATQMSTEWRKLSLEAMRNAIHLMTPSV